MTGPQERQWQRRAVLGSGLAMCAGLFLPGANAAAGQGEPEWQVPYPNEDMMREHSVLRRALLAYREVTRRLREGRSAKGLAGPLNETAMLFRRFGEDYHERAIEEKYVFPDLLKASYPATRYPPVLVAQHEKGREVTSWLLELTRDGNIPGGSIRDLERVLDEFILMYEHHAAIEDTEAYVVWKKNLGQERYMAMRNTFEEVEHGMFGRDGFEDAVKRVSQIEQTLGIADLGKFTVTRIPK